MQHVWITPSTHPHDALVMLSVSRPGSMLCARCHAVVSHVRSAHRMVDLTTLTADPHLRAVYERTLIPLHELAAWPRDDEPRADADLDVRIALAAIRGRIVASRDATELVHALDATGEFRAWMSAHAPS